MDVIAPLEKPSRTFHAVWAYWLTSREGFNENAQGKQASRIASVSTDARCLDALPTQVQNCSLEGHGHFCLHRKTFSLKSKRSQHCSRFGRIIYCLPSR